MRAPFFVVVCDNGDISAFPDLTAAIQSMEAIDVMNGVYRLFDADGLLLDLTVAKDRWVVFGIDLLPIDRIVLGSRSESRPDELRQLLQTALAHGGWHRAPGARGARTRQLLEAALAQRGVASGDSSLEDLVLQASIAFAEPRSGCS